MRENVRLQSGGVICSKHECRPTLSEVSLTRLKNTSRVYVCLSWRCKSGCNWRGGTWRVVPGTKFRSVDDGDLSVSFPIPCSCGGSTKLTSFSIDAERVEVTQTCYSCAENKHMVVVL